MSGLLVGLGLFLVGLLIAGLGAAGTFSAVVFGIGVAMAVVGAIALFLAIKSG